MARCWPYARGWHRVLFGGEKDPVVEDGELDVGDARGRLRALEQPAHGRPPLDDIRPNHLRCIQGSDAFALKAHRLLCSVPGLSCSRLRLFYSRLIDFLI